MDEHLKSQLAQCAIEGAVFSEDPGWFFVFLENGAMVKELRSLFAGKDAEEEEAILVFARGAAWESLLDACGALYRMKETALTFGKDLVLEKQLTQFLKSPASREIRTAFGVPEGMEMVGAVLVKDAVKKERELRWDVFSSVQ